MNFDDAMLAFRAQITRDGFRRSADQFAFEARQIEIELENERRRDARREAALTQEPPCFNA